VLLLNYDSAFAVVHHLAQHLGLDVDRAFRAFTENTGTPHYPEGYFNILSGAEALAKNSAYVTITLIADAFLVRRTVLTGLASVLRTQ
jgi:hypothetical protein